MWINACGLANLGLKPNSELAYLPSVLVGTLLWSVASTVSELPI